MGILLSAFLGYLLCNSILLAIWPRAWGRSRWSGLPAYYRRDLGRRTIAIQVRLLGVIGVVIISLMAARLDVSHPDLNQLLRIAVAFAWIEGGCIHLLLPTFLIDSYPTAIQPSLRENEAVRLCARAFGALTIVLGVAVLVKAS
jgi:hypothetical protein